MICRILVGLFVLAWAAGTALFAAQTWGGMHGYVVDLLTALVMTPLGLPWNLSALAVSGATTKMAIALAAPVVNLGLLLALCAVCRRACRVRPA